MSIPSNACTRAAMRAMDRRAIEEYGMPGVVLMENAGSGAARIALDMLKTAPAPRVVLFCGKGNNGGDGYVIARHLHNHGAQTAILLACDPDSIVPTSDAGIHLGIVRRMGIPVHAAESDPCRCAAGIERGADLIVDALLGTGLTGDVREPYSSLIQRINAAQRPVLSVDIPSGLDADTGAILGVAVRATCTATFVLPKQGFFRRDGPARVGALVVLDIGMPRAIYALTKS